MCLRFSKAPESSPCEHANCTWVHVNNWPSASRRSLTDSVLPGAQLRKRRLAERIRDDMESEDLSSTRRKLLVCLKSSCPHLPGDLAANSYLHSLSYDTQLDGIDRTSSSTEHDQRSLKASRDGYRLISAAERSLASRRPLDLQLADRWCQWHASQSAGRPHAGA